MMLLAMVLACAPQDPLQAVLESEQRRVQVIERCASAVCSVMSMDAPGGGSGVIFDPAGFVLTNFHVVGEPDKDYRPPRPPEPPEDVLKDWRMSRPTDSDAEAEFIANWKKQWKREHRPQGTSHYKNKKIGLADGKLYEAVVLGIDPGSDLAVLRLLPKEPGQTWPHCDLGDSDSLLVGETVFAMGNPFLLATDFTPTVTFGIVSGTHRYQEGQGQRMLVYPDCIQVDAPVNPGNSGGPLFNEAGDVIGINGRISLGDRGRVNVGVGFAISSNQIRNFLGDLIAGRHAEHGTLDMSAWFMKARNDEKRRGVFVQQKFKDSVVSDIGVGLGDEITNFNGTAVRSANQLATLVGVLPADTWVTLSYRPSSEGGFGSERTGSVRLTALDTGSSRDETRLASIADRRIATDRLAARFEAVADDGPAIQWNRIGPSGSEVRSIAHGHRIRIDLGERSIVLNGEEGFALEGGGQRKLTANERERLRRERAANPVLWPAAERALRLKQALLLGGVHVHGRAAFRFGLPGDGDCEAWFFADGEPAGYAFRDPIAKAHVEVYLRGESMRVVADGKLEKGWSNGHRETGPVDESWFGGKQQ